MGGSPTINVLVYTLVGGLPKNKVKPFTPGDRWIVQKLIKMMANMLLFPEKDIDNKYIISGLIYKSVRFRLIQTKQQ